LKLSFFRKFSINDLFKFLFLVYVLQGIAIDDRVLMTWKKHSDGVRDVLIDNTNILFEKAGDATLRLRRRFMSLGFRV
jgi:hypothetical protein